MRDNLVLSGEREGAADAAQRLFLPLWSSVAALSAPTPPARRSLSCSKINFLFRSRYFLSSSLTTAISAKPWCLCALKKSPHTDAAVAESEHRSQPRTVHKSGAETSSAPPPGVLGTPATFRRLSTAAGAVPCWDGPAEHTEIFSRQLHTLQCLVLLPSKKPVLIPAAFLESHSWIAPKLPPALPCRSCGGFAAGASLQGNLPGLQRTVPLSSDPFPTGQRPGAGMEIPTAASPGPARRLKPICPATEGSLRMLH